METWMKFLQRPIMPSKTVNDWVTGIDSRSIPATVNDPESPPFICVLWKPNKIPLATANDPERLPMTGSE